MSKPITKNQLADFWLANYLHKEHCGLCGNSGVIDTRGVRTAAGVECGGRFWCVCPNGDAYRRQAKGKGPGPYEPLQR